MPKQFWNPLDTVTKLFFLFHFSKMVQENMIITGLGAQLFTRVHSLIH